MDYLMELFKMFDKIDVKKMVIYQSLGIWKTFLFMQSNWNVTKIEFIWYLSGS